MQAELQVTNVFTLQICAAGAQKVLAHSFDFCAVLSMSRVEELFHVHFYIVVRNPQNSSYLLTLPILFGLVDFVTVSLFVVSVS